MNIFTYQCLICGVRIVLGIWCVNSQGDAVGEDGEQNEPFEWSVRK